MLDELAIAEKVILKTDLSLLTIHFFTSELASYGKQQVFVKAKGYVHVYGTFLSNY